MKTLIAKSLIIAGLAVGSIAQAQAGAYCNIRTCPNVTDSRVAAYVSQMNIILQESAGERGKLNGLLREVAELELEMESINDLYAADINKKLPPKPVISNIGKPVKQNLHNNENLMKIVRKIADIGDDPIILMALQQEFKAVQRQLDAEYDKAMDAWNKSNDVGSVEWEREVAKIKSDAILAEANRDKMHRELDAEIEELIKEISFIENNLSVVNQQLAAYVPIINDILGARKQEAAGYEDYNFGTVDLARPPLGSGNHKPVITVPNKDLTKGQLRSAHEARLRKANANRGKEKIDKSFLEDHYKRIGAHHVGK